MARINYLLICESIVVDKENRPTVVSIFDVVNATEVPVIASRFTIAMNFKIEPEDVLKGETRIRVAIEHTDGTKAMEANLVEENIPAPLNVASSLDLSEQLVFDKYGKYFLRLDVNGTQIAETEFEVKFANSKEIAK